MVKQANVLRWRRKEGSYWYGKDEIRVYRRERSGTWVIFDRRSGESYAASTLERAKKFAERLYSE